MSVCANDSSGARSLHSVPSLARPLSAAGWFPSVVVFGLGSGNPATLAGSKKPVGLPSVATSARWLAACPASSNPAASATRGSVASVASSALIRLISAFCPLFTSLVNWNSTGS